ncbi:hypothetical protein [Haloplanus halophilus]|uniref:hypothetical protein n=1 Tax=Haloplanus halophilus TaxID=2949993 RepID=UPI00203EFB3F|nr:hypothetical protein [Haloplanus sp. GDY1]
MNRDTACDLLTGRGPRLAAVVVVTLLVAAATVGAAGATTVRLAAADDVAVSETTTVDVVVDDASGGVGAYNVTVALTDPSIASITNVELLGDPSARTSRVDLAADGSSATMVAALTNTADTGDVTIARVTLRGDGPGSTGLDLTVAALGDERGDSYTTDARATNLTVLGDGSGERAGATDGSDGGSSENRDDHSGGAAAAESSADGTPLQGQLRNARLDAITKDPVYLVAFVGLALVALIALRRLS